MLFRSVQRQVNNWTAGVCLGGWSRGLVGVRRLLSGGAARGSCLSGPVRISKIVAIEMVAQATSASKECKDENEQHHTASGCQLSSFHD